MSTTKTFDQFFEALQDAYAMEIDDTVMLPAFEEELHEEYGNVVIIYDEWNGHITIPIELNGQIEFDEVSRDFTLNGFTRAYEESTFRIRLLKLM